MLNRKNLSGIYIFDKFPNEKKATLTCIEDCQLETRLAWLRSLKLEKLKQIAERLNEIEKNLIKCIGEKLQVTPLNLSGSRDNLIGVVNKSCKNIVNLSIKYNIEAT